MVKSKKMAALILAAMLAVSSSAAMAVTVSAEEGTAVAYSSSDTKSWGDYDYRVLDDGTVEITKYTGKDTNITIPSKIDGNKVTSIGESAFSYCENLKNVKVPNCVKTIQSYAFNNCTSLENINIPNSVEKIGNNVFFSCRKLNNVVLPKGITTISDNTFMNCNSLSNITIPDTVKTIGYQAFAWCISLKNIDIPDSVTKIESSAFWLSALESVKIPNNMRTIGNQSFSGCRNLVNVEIPDSVRKIEDSAFFYCTNLLGVKIPDSVTEIEKGAFGYAQDIKYDVTIYGVKDSEAENYAKKENFKFVDLDDESLKNNLMIDDITKIELSGSIPQNAQLKTRTLDPLEVPQNIRENLVFAYDISLELNGESVQPTGEIKIAIPCDNPNCSVWWFDEETGQEKNVGAVYIDGYYIFTINHLSKFALIPNNTDIKGDESSQEPSNEPSNESSNEQSNTISDSSKSNSDTNNTDSNKTTSETGKNGVETGDSNNLFAMAAMLTGAITAISTIIFKKKRT